MNATSNIRRLREQALNSAALITAISSSRLEADSPLRKLSVRQDEQLTELLHDFAFRARRLIELAKREGIPVNEAVERNSVAGVPGTDSPSEPVESELMRMYSVWFILNRVIHSDDFEVERAEVPLDSDQTIRHELPWGFRVRSDRDERGIHHFIFIEFLLNEFLAVDRMIESYLDRSNLCG
jgi:hypothetical protein